MLRAISALLPLVLYAALIFALSAQSGLGTLPPVFGIDKVLHVIEYAGLGFLAARALLLLRDLPPRRAAVLGFVLASLYGATDELHQAYVPGRFSSGWDLLADVIGSALGAYALVLYARLVRAFGRTRTEAT